MTRPFSKELDAILGKKILLPGGGFITPIDYMGNEDEIIRSARISYGKGTKGSSDNNNLLRYLYRHRHTSPFEMCEIKFHVKTSISTARQWLRHRMASVNEYSGRYSIMPNEFYIPETFHPQSTNNKQGRKKELILDTEALQGLYISANNMSLNRYMQLLDAGVAREQARDVLPLSIMTEFVWKIDLHNLLHFIKLRYSSHAQKEIRDYAGRILDVLNVWVPQVISAFNDYTHYAVTFSRHEKEVLHDLLKGRTHNEINDLVGHKEGLSSREKNELSAKLMELLK